MINRNRLTLGAALFCVLSALYLITYTGTWISNDGLYLFDSTESIVRRGNLDTTYLYDLVRAPAAHADPFAPGQQEPLQPLLAAPLFWLAERLPGIGLIHTVWLFNVFVTAGTGVLVYVGALLLGTGTAAAWVTGLIYGVATGAWAYAQTFFREPLGGLFLLGVLLAAVVLRQRLNARADDPEPPGLLAPALALLLSAVALLLTKFALIFALVPLLLLTLPDSVRLRARGRLLLVFVTVMVAALLLLLAAGTLLGVERFTLDYWYPLLADVEWRYVVEALAGYTVSPGRSLILYSPGLLLALPGAWLLIRQGYWRFPAVLLLTLLVVIVSYGAGRSFIWWGGASWGPRHLVPLIPVLMVLAAPAVDALLRPGTRAFWRAAAAALVLVGMIVQLLGTLVWLYRHYDALAAADRLIWEAGMWSWEWSPIAYHARLISLDTLRTAWTEAADPLQGALVAGLALLVLLLALAGGLKLLRRPSAPRWLHTGLRGALPAALLIIIVLGLLVIRDDPRLYTNPSVRALVDWTNDRAARSDAVVIQPLNFQYTFMNQQRSAGVVVTLPYAPGENLSPGMVPAADADPVTLLGEGVPRALDWLARHYDRLWLAVDTTPGLPGELRPTEYYLVMRHYPFADLRADSTHRLIGFDTRPVAAAPTSGLPTADFGGVIRLEGAALPAGDVYAPGDIVPVSLFWSALERPAEDYLISVQVAPDGAPPVVQWDGPPQQGFGQTASWQPGEQHADHYGLLLPDELPPGDYTIQVIVYRYPTLERLPVNGGDIAVLTTITVSP